MSGEKVEKPTCSECGSDQVLVDAFAAWDMTSQQWELASTYPDTAYCESCDGTCSVNWEVES